MQHAMSNGYIRSFFLTKAANPDLFPRIAGAPSVQIEPIFFTSQNFA